jgi:hypothetical protein
MLIGQLCRARRGFRGRKRRGQVWRRASRALWGCWARENAAISSGDGGGLADRRVHAVRSLVKEEVTREGDSGGARGVWLGTATKKAARATVCGSVGNGRWVVSRPGGGGR